MPDSIYISSDGVINSANPDILPEVSETAFLGTAPSVCRRILQPADDNTHFVNTILTGKFKTNDDRNDPSMLFITAYRRGPEDGETVDHFYNGYGIAVMPLNAKSAADGRYNIFVVDNSLAIPQVVLENVMHTGWGDMPYLAAVSAVLNPETWYNFELHFLAGGAIRFFLAPDGSLFGPPIITYGAYQHQSDGTYYGVSVSYNEGYKWSVDHLSLVHAGAMYAYNEYLIDSSPFSDVFTLSTYAFASGYDGVNPTPAYGVLMYLWNYTTAAWDFIASHAFGPGDGSFLLAAANLALADYASPADGYIRVLVVSQYPSDLTNAIESYLWVDETMTSNWSSLFSNVGGMGDVYLHESSLPVQYAIDLYNVGALEWLMASNPIITGDFHLPIMFIEKVEQIDAMGNVIGLLVEGLDYLFSVVDQYRRYSADERNIIRFTAGGGINVRITYLTFTNVEAVQDYVIADGRANFADDLLAFSKIPWEVFVTLDYRGSKARAEVRTAFVDWVMGTAGDEIDVNTIEAALQAYENVSNVRVTLLSVRKHNQLGTFDVETADTITLSDSRVQQFMTLDDATHIGFTPESD